MKLFQTGIKHGVGSGPSEPPGFRTLSRTCWLPHHASDMPDMLPPQDLCSHQFLVWNTLPLGFHLAKSLTSFWF